MRNELRVLYLVFQNMFAYNLMVFVAFNTCNTYMLSNRGGCGLVSGNKCFLFRTYSPRVFWGHQMDRRSHQAGQMENVGVHLPIFFEFVYFPKMKPTYQIYTATGCLMTLWFFLKCMKIYLVYRWKEVYTAAGFCSSTCKHVRLPQYALYEFLQMVWASVHFRIHDCTIGLIYLALWQSFHYKYRAHN